RVHRLHPHLSRSRRCAVARHVGDGGTGAAVFTLNGILYGLSTSSLGFATGSNGQVLQIGDTGSPVFAVLDGGEY
ncbi:MAG: hypothetical protein ACO3UU_05060, partial [Minisyncoccia bacterium]